MGTCWALHQIQFFVLTVKGPFWVSIPSSGSLHQDSGFPKNSAKAGSSSRGELKSSSREGVAWGSGSSGGLSTGDPDSWKVTQWVGCCSSDEAFLLIQLHPFNLCQLLPWLVDLVQASVLPHVKEWLRHSIFSSNA